jgi:hypothetical protein
LDSEYLRDAYIELPETVKNWVGDDLAAQVRDAYEEISQHKPHGDIPR